MTLLHDDELADYRASVKERGYKESDFKLDEGKIEGPPNDGSVGPLTGTVTVTYEPTGVSREYATGHVSKWVAEFDTDLNGGAFSG